MLNQDHHAQNNAAGTGSDAQHVTSRTRRRLVTAATGGVGVVLAVTAKTALGSTLCQSPSAMISGNTSPRPGDTTPCSGGRSPGFWKVPQHFTYWPTAGATAPTFKVVVNECMNGLGNLNVSDIATKGTLVNSVLPGAFSSNDPGIWAVLAFPTDYANGQLMRALICAWLNAGFFEYYPLTKKQVVDMWDQVKSGGIYCPSGTSCGSNGMTAEDIRKYIEDMYDINAVVENDLCKKQN